MHSRYTTDTHNKPLATQGLVSYRYKGRWGYIMIGAHDHDDAMAQAARSTDGYEPDRAGLEIWNAASGQYELVPMDKE